MIDRKQNKRIADPWYVEIEVSTKDRNTEYDFVRLCRKDDEVRINLVNASTGEIRQKCVSLDQLARRCFESEISSWKDIELEDNI
jgi:hypothetical protein